ncbi:urease accessory protein UreE [Sphingomonas populi]|uniref:Urease accessory protein UreE n=1 Tax=Sphingomonas populi TaxID=2484750 RepID=A0A4Q6XTH4_9SPHN|nr:urease accessory protein UreE [Sphingomonas populi]RZF63261.1 urease accessory protein UreE [Sphingomonas populi]
MVRIAAVEAGRGSTADDSITLDFDHRNRRRIVLHSDRGTAMLLDMPRAVHLRDGEMLLLEDGARVRVVASDEALLDIDAADVGALVRIAWHLGNRHLPTQLLAGANGGTLRIRADHVIEAMVEGLGGRCTPIAAPFDPEGGAYAEGTGGGHHHHHHHHEHAHG